MENLTIARVVPAKTVWRFTGFSAYEPFAQEGKLAYSNSTPQCLAHVVALSRSTQERGLEFSLSTSGSPSVMDATMFDLKTGSATLTPQEGVGE
jgi:hypothetical protein